MNDRTSSDDFAARTAAVTTCRVIFGDTDAGGVVYHPDTWRWRNAAATS